MQDYDNPYSPPQSENDFISQKSKYQKTGEQVRVVSFLEWLVILVPVYVLTLMIEKSILGLILVLLLPIAYIFIFKNKNITNYVISTFIFMTILIATIVLGAVLFAFLYAKSKGL